MRKLIMHYDMDAFYASIEIRDNPKYKDKPIVVAGGVVTTASYPARKFGIHSAMNTLDAKRLCPKLIVLPVNKDKYSKESKLIQELILKITHKVEFIALDEGFVDITDIISKFSSKERFGNIFRKRIYEITGLTCSVGIGPNKLTAKIASDINKPGGQYIFNNEDEFIEFIKDKKIRKLPGVGKQFEKLLNKNNILFVKDIYPFSLKELISKFGESRGGLLYTYSRGIDHREVEFNKATHSIGNENTFRLPLDSEEEISREIDLLFQWSYNRLKKKQFLTKTLSLKVRFTNRETITRSKTRFLPSDDKVVLKEMLDELLISLNLTKGIKLLGVSFSNLENISNRQLTFEKFY
ncbi:DNA polymerase IV [Candidatus Cetobacterium colombiensis]|uniref:DNA polymerase IV n=1 Tax=Candidatus Cetobacterium colombiensis TaxID=3073100 RepID=A0ABU4W949_9FUSO|nr:DNA polymerase IV [Candidatus Cetobacterium colombiensis]MDX8335121.1 DNA polymerase IV [Candidatus Cetobacterium colombiensis]